MVSDEMLRTVIQRVNNKIMLEKANVEGVVCSYMRKEIAKTEKRMKQQIEFAVMSLSKEIRQLNKKIEVKQDVNIRKEKKLLVGQ